MRLSDIASMRLLQILFTSIFVLFVGCSVQQDSLEAQKSAERINSQLRSHDYASVYREAEQSFREAVDEARFVADMQRLYDEKGSLTTATPIAYQTGVDSNAGRIHILIFNLEFERGRAKERIVLTRSTNGQMQLRDFGFDSKP